MRAKSLRLRLSITASLSLCVALVLAGVALVALFERYVIRRVGVELDTYIRQLAANVSIEPDGALQLGRPLADPRFDQPLSGLYWQIVEDGAGVKLGRAPYGTTSSICRMTRSSLESPTITTSPGRRARLYFWGNAA